MNTEPVVKVNNDEIHPLIFTPETIEKFWLQAKQFPTLYGHEIVGDINKFIDLFFRREGTVFVPYGLFWVMNPEKFTGVFYLTDIREEDGALTDAHAHYTFFDRRHHGRVPLVKEMLKFWFTKYGFQRLSAEIPNYVTPQARHFAMECGMAYEGKRRAAAKYKGEWFAVNLYGVLRSEVLKNG
jgi:RimJ/RimL family protein N-acetyltransferase